ncbi:MAG: hypothetical protein MK207_04535 [Saprospiraceae bacterium]|nr:hypothetical protein [Saprospiraceae bacterium]
MKPLLFILIIFFLGISACQVPEPEYSLDILQGTWLRVWSTDVRSDSMEISIDNNIGTIVYVPASSDFVVGTKKWTNIASIAEAGDFNLLDLSADTLSYNSIINMKSDTTLEIVSEGYQNAPGGKQLWTKLP